MSLQEYDQITSSEEDTDSENDWEAVGFAELMTNEDENVYNEIIDQPQSPKLSSKCKISPITKNNSSSIERFNLPPPPKISEHRNSVIAKSEDKPNTANQFTTAALAGVLKARLKQTNSAPPPPPSSHNKPHSSQENRTLHELPSVNKPPSPPNVTNLSHVTSQNSSTEPPTRSFNKPVPPPPPPSQKKPSQMKNQSSSHEYKSIGINKPTQPSIKNKLPTQLINKPVASTKPLPPQSMNKPQWKIKNPDQAESTPAKSVDIPAAGITSALKSRFEIPQKRSTESTVHLPHKSKPNMEHKDSSITTALKAKLENRLMNEERDSKPKEAASAKTLVLKKVSQPEADKPRFKPKPLTPESTISFPKYDLKSVEKSRDRELPRENTTSSLKSKFELGFGKPGKSDRPVLGNIPKPSIKTKFGSHEPDVHSSESSEETPRPNSAASLRAMFEKSSDKPNPKALTQKPNLPTKHTVGPKKPTFGQNAMKSNYPGQDTKKPILKGKPNLPQKKQIVFPSKQKENEKNSQNINVSDIANVLKTKLDFGGGLGSIETPKSTAQHSSTKSIQRQPKDKSEHYVMVADFTADGGISFTAGTEVEVLEKNEGWWWIRVGEAEGWAPETYLEPLHLHKITYNAICSFGAENEGEISLREGQELEVLDKVEEWWFIRTDAGEGWAPASYIQQI